MTARLRPDRLWPMLTVLGALVVGTGALEAAARNRAASTVVIQVDDAASTLGGDDDGGLDGLAPAEERAVDPRQEQARLAARRGEFDAAFDLFAAVLKDHPDAAAVRADQGFWLLAAGRDAEALRALDDAATSLPQDARIAHLRGAARAANRDRKGAETEYLRALALRPSYSAARLALATSLVRRREPRAALEALGPLAGVGDGATRARVLIVRGRAELELGDRTGAKRDFDRALEWAPSRATSRLTIARAWLDAGDREDLSRALETLLEAVAVAPDLAAMHSALGTVYERIDRPAEAEGAYERAVALEPGYRYARRRLVRLALARRDFFRARSHADQLLAGAPEVPEHHFLAALVAAREGRLDTARQHYADAIAKANGTYPEAYHNIGLLEREAGRLAPAIAAYERAVEQRPKYLEALNNLALAYAATGRGDDAEKTLRKALAIDPGYAAAWQNLGHLLMGTPRAAEALAAAQRAAELKPGDARAQLTLGQVYLRAGKLEEAVATLRAVVAAHPRYARAHTELGAALDRSGRADEALAAFRRARELDGESADTLRGLAALAARQGRKDEAVSTYEALLDLEPNDAATRHALAEARAQ